MPMRYKNLVTEEELRALLTPEEMEQIEREQGAGSEHGDGEPGVTGSEDEAAVPIERTREATAHVPSARSSAVSASEAWARKDGSERRDQPGDLLSMRILQLETLVEALTVRVSILERRLERFGERADEERNNAVTAATHQTGAIEVEARVGREMPAANNLPNPGAHENSADEGETPLSRKETYSGRKHTKKKSWF